MSTAQELIDIWHFLERRENDFMELDRRLCALLNVVKSQPRLFDSYLSIYRVAGSSKVVLQHEQTIQTIHEKLARLSETPQTLSLDTSNGSFSTKTQSETPP